MSGIFEISYMAVGIEDIVGMVQMVGTVGMEIHNMLEPQLKINKQIIVKLEQFLNIAFMQISTNLCIEFSKDSLSCANTN